MKRIRVDHGGLLTTVQDLGRYGFQQYGVSVSGAMDAYSIQLANLLVGNEPGEAALECTFAGPELTFLGRCVFAVAGGDLEPLLNGKRIASHAALEAEKGDVLQLRSAKAGMRAYIAFAGGIDVMPVMNSKSTYLKAGFGGFEGRKLMKEDCLKIGGSEDPYRFQTVPFRDTILSRSRETLRVVWGPEKERFSAKSLKTFLGETFTLSNQCDRMGYRLDGPVLEHVDGADILSGGITLGAVQVPGHGHPIIMMADRQTIGGYTKIANVITADIDLLAQMKPGDPVRFEAVSVQEAQTFLRERQEKIEALREEITGGRKRYKEPREFRVGVNGNAYILSVREIIEE